MYGAKFTTTHDSEVVEIDDPGEQTTLEEDRGEVDYAVQYKVDNLEELKKFSEEGPGDAPEGEEEGTEESGSDETVSVSKDKDSNTDSKSS